MKLWEKYHQVFILFQVLNKDLNTAACTAVLEAVPPLYVQFGSTHAVCLIGKHLLLHTASNTGAMIHSGSNHCTTANSNHQTWQIPISLSQVSVQLRPEQLKPASSHSAGGCSTALTCCVATCSSEDAEILSDSYSKTTLPAFTEQPDGGWFFQTGMKFRLSLSAHQEKQSELPLWPKTSLPSPSVEPSYSLITTCNHRDNWKQSTPGS